MMKTEYCFAWWNLENLFDVENVSYRPDWINTKIRSELKGWGPEQLNLKLKQLAQVIVAMNDGRGPDLLGVCEVESSQVLKRLISTLHLPNRQYEVVHADNNDKRGIDVAFIYDRTFFSVETEIDPDTGQSNDNVFHHVIQKRSATRDIVQVNFKTQQGRDFIVIGNHWPSRSGGELQSEPYRMMAGETLAYFMDRIKTLRGEIPVFVMGDFNDEPFNRSMTKYALSMNNLKKVKSTRAKNPYLFNLMWPLMDGSLGSHSFNGIWGMLDQMLVNRAGLASQQLFTAPGNAEIMVFPGMVKGNKVIRHARPARSSYNPKGYSDHLPLLLTVTEKH
ncbi:MAG: endonuclease/exonuclease/phosphatase family protein [Motiliproteus sp.]